MRKCFYILILILVNGKLISQTLNDTIKIREVEIFAKRELKDIAKSKTKFDTIVLQQSINESMAELLSEHSPVFIKQAGRGSMATISFRGSSASHTDVLWNGISIKSPMIGQVDFSLLPINFIDNIEIYSGGSSIEKSTGALGGSICLDNKIDWNNKNKVKFIQTLGSYSTFSDFLQFNLGKRKIKTNTRLLYSSSDNDYKFKNKNILDINMETGEYIYPTQKNVNANYNQYGILQEFYYKPKTNLIVSLKYWLQNIDRNLPRLNTYEGDDYSNINNQIDLNNRIIADAKYFKNNNKFTYQPALLFQKMDYSQSNFISGLGYENVVFSQSQTKSLYNKLKFKHNFKHDAECNFNLDINHDNVNNNDTVSKQGYSKKRNEYIMYMAYNQQFEKRIGLSLMLRKYFSDDYIMPISPFLGLEYFLNKEHNISTKLNLTRNFKYPSLNDLFWQPGGNSSLKPEESLSSDFSISFNKKTDILKIKSEFTGFYSDVKNWIIWLPSPMAYWTPQNIGNVVSKGIEYYLNILFTIKRLDIKMTGNYSFTDARNYGDKAVWGTESYGKQLPYIPKHSGNILISISKNNYNFSYTHNSYSERFTTSSNDFTLRDWLYPYFMNNISFSKRFKMLKSDFAINFKIYNLFNEEYRSILGRPMPGRNYLLSLNINL